MLIGVPKEIKNHEYRVGLTPDGVAQLVGAGHTVQVEASAGARVGLVDEAYQAAGAKIVSSAADVFGSDLVIKVKELQRSEFGLTHPAQILFCYHHFAPDPELLDAMLSAKVACVAYA